MGNKKESQLNGVAIVDIMSEAAEKMEC